MLENKRYLMIMEYWKSRLRFFCDDDYQRKFKKLLNLILPVLIKSHLLRACSCYLFENIFPSVLAYSLDFSKQKNVVMPQFENS